MVGDAKEILVYFFSAGCRFVAGLVAVELKHREIGVEVKMFKSHNF
jgi:hypothetical protein